jgi:hypothetical protein
MIENGTTLFTSSPFGFNNVTCGSIGSWDIPKGITNVTLRALSLASAQALNVYLEVHTVCNSTGGYIYLNGSNPNYFFRNESYNAYGFESQASPYGGVNESYVITNPNYAANIWGNHTPSHCVAQTQRLQLVNQGIGINWGYLTWNQMNFQRFGFCVQSGANFDLRCDYLNWYSSSGSFYNEIRMNTFVPFNSKLGIVGIVINSPAAGGSFSGAIAGIFNPETHLRVVDLGILSAGLNSFNVTLDSYKDYVVYVTQIRNTGNSFEFVPLINLTINDYTPILNCTYGACINQTRQITCNDTGNVLPPTITFQSCLQVNQTVILGFENYYTPPNRFVCQPVLYPLCGLAGYEGFGALANVTVLFPNNPKWDVQPDFPINYVATITSETATQGSRSLKMWFVPQSPFNDQPTTVGNSTLCLNTSTGTIPTVLFGGVNASFLASLNFTFPSQTMKLSFDVKKCGQNVIQYNNWCGKRCYAQNCTTLPLGWYQVRLFEQGTFAEVFDYTYEATDNWTTISVDLGSNVLTDINYTLGFSVYPLPFNPTSTDGNCVYFDNIKLVNQQFSIYDEWTTDVFGEGILWTDLTDGQKQTVLVQKCVSQCEGDDYHTRTIQNLVCLETVILNDSTCVSTNPVNIISGNQSLFLPIGSICNSIVNQTTNQTLCESTKASGFGFALIFLTPIFWLMLLVIGIMTLVSWLTSHMEIGAFTGVLMLVVLTWIFPELLFITIVVCIIAGYIVGKAIVKTVAGGGG